MDQSIIRVYVGEIIKDKKDEDWLIFKMEPNGIYNFLNITRSIEFPKMCRCTWIGFKHYYQPIVRIGKARGTDLLEGEDWLCHDGRCYPGVLAGGCYGCEYSRLVKERKRYFEPGDEVWIPSEKKARKVIETALFSSTNINGPYSYFKVGHVYDDRYYSIRFKLEKYPIENKYYRWDQIRLVKRDRHFINLKQLKHVCNDLCLFGPYGGVRCSDCETGKIWKKILT